MLRLRRLLDRVPWLGILTLLLLLKTPLSPLQMIHRSPIHPPPQHLAGWADEDERLEAKVIYGDDNRVDVHVLSDPNRRHLSRSTAAIVSRSDLKASGIDRSRLRSVEYGLAYNLCADEPFRTQPTAAFCTAFLVAPDVVATAGHCVRTAQSCGQQAYVFSFELDTPSRDSTLIDNQDVYFCRELIGSEVNANGRDWALVRLDRPVVDREPLALRRSGAISTGEDLLVIGHPAGIPKKIADGARVRSTSNPMWFSAELDTYGGNSGSPVFNAHTYEVEGILVRGENDFVSAGRCMRSNVCASGTCHGEEVTRITQVTPRIPNF